MQGGHKKEAFCNNFYVHFNVLKLSIERYNYYNNNNNNNNNILKYN